MTTVDEQDGGLVVNTKGAPEEVLARVTRIHRGDRDVAITAADRDEAARVMTGYAQRGLRVLAVARRVLPAGSAVPAQRQDAEQDLCLTGMAAMLDPPRPQVPAAIARLHRAGIRVNVVTGDNGLTAAAIARQRRHRQRARRHEGRHRHRAGRDDRNPARRPARLRHGSGLRAKLPRSQAAHRRRAALRRPGRRHDRRRGQRRPRAAPRRHRRRDGSLRDRRRPRGRHDDPHRRQLRHHRRGRRIRPADLRQRPQVHLLHLRPRRPRGRAVPRLRPGRRGDPAAADRHADPRHRPGHRHPPRAGAQPRARRAGPDGPPAAAPHPGRDQPRRCSPAPGDSSA